MPSRVATQVVASLFVVALLLAAMVLPVPYVSRAPGPVYNTLGTIAGSPVITISGAATYPTTGRLDLTTVSESGGPGRRQLSLLQAIQGWLSSSVAVILQPLVYPPGTSGQEVQQQGTLEMQDSQDTAEIVALRAAGIPVTPTVVVDTVEAGGPSDGKLKEGDVFVSVNGTPVSGDDDLRADIAKVQPGDVVHLVVKRGGREVAVDVTTVPSTDDPTHPMIGVSLRLGYESPATVNIKLGSVVGPSAGLMFTLGIYDKLTPGELTGGLHLAGTGTIAADGSVGPIGGIQQKMRAARDAGATAFFVPAQNCSEALPAKPSGLRLVKVSTFDQALTAVRALASGNPTTSSVPGC
ncbi:MAG TPA: PDZ domain-containing protein [Actinomycetes bacterium]|nr:PDZ domain-containing protein [Actinomycetes bacterium]